MERLLRVLIPEDSESDAVLLLRALDKLGYRPEHRRVDDRAGMRAALEEQDWDLDLVNAGGQPTTLKPGACFFDSASAFGMIRGGHIDVTVLGAYQVSEQGDIANWAVGEEITGVGGAMDMCCGAKRIFVIMEHATKDGMPRIVRRCTYRLTAEGVVSTIFTNLAVIDVVPKGLMLREVAPGLTPEVVQDNTEPRLILPETVLEMSL